MGPRIICGVSSEALKSRDWQTIIAVDNINLSNLGIMDVKRTRHVVTVAKGLQTFVGGQHIEEDVDVDIWRYRVNIERLWVLIFCS